MTVAAAAAKAGPYTGNDSASAFAFSFKVFADADIRVVKTVIATSVETDFVLNTDYTVTRNADQDASPGGSVTYKVGGVTTALPSTLKLTIVGDFDYAQPTDIPNGGSFFASVIETAFDRVTMLIKQLKEQSSRALVFPVSDTDPTVDLPTDRASKYLAFDTDGNPVASAGTPAADIVTPFMETVLDDTTAVAARTTLGLGTMAVETATDYIAKATLTTTGDSFVATAPNTPARLAALASVAAHATTMNLWAARENVLTGAVVTVTDIADAPYAGAVAWVKMNDAHIWDDGAVFDVQGGADYTAAAGDWLRIYATTVSTFEVTIFKASGAATVATTPVFSLSYSSGNQTISNAGLLTLAHGLGVAPKIVQFFAICLTGEYNWTAGQIIPVCGLGNQYSGAGSTANGFAADVSNATNITVRFGALANPITALDATSGALQALTSANWALIVRAYA